MIVISHRGHWLAAQEKNTIEAFRRSFAAGFGTETDLRDQNGQVVISHDPPNGPCISFSDFIAIFLEYAPGLPLALNIKADGLQGKIREALAGTAMPNLFFFDMSIPDAVQYVREGLPVFTRHSDWEESPSFYDAARGVWLDAFDDEAWYDSDVIARHLDAGKKVCIVSNELHRRDHRAQWERLAGMHLHTDQVILCTDLPKEAQVYFNA